jgi:HD-GYP domain-containing protein (c-di-GMP phosphodiesterase class II)
MTTDRPYRKRLGAEDARRRLREGAGSQFDPAVVDVFLGIAWATPLGEAHSNERLAS